MEIPDGPVLMLGICLAISPHKMAQQFDVTWNHQAQCKASQNAPEDWIELL